MKTCSHCHVEKPLDAFPKAKHMKLGRHSWCRECSCKALAEKRAANPEPFREADNARYAADPEPRRKRAREWAKANREKRNLYRLRRRAAKRNAPLNDLTQAQWDEILGLYGHRCVYCGRKMKRLTMDHITPLSKGGSHTVSNVVPACQSCNFKKNAGEPPVPVQPLLLTIAPPKKPKQ